MTVPFSNGYEGSVWQNNWCDRCIHDHSMHTDYVPDDWDPSGCPIFARTLLYDEMPTVWQPYAEEWWFGMPVKIACHGFEPCEHCEVSVMLRPPVYGEVTHAQRA